MSAKMIKCKSCGCDIASTAKSCPNCGAKNKKSIFKKWWFWLIVVIVVIGVAAGSSGGSDTPEVSSNGETVNQTETVESKKEESAKETKKTSDVVEKTEATTAKVSIGKINALGSAKTYLWTMAFSYKGLVEQLEFEGYTEEEAVYAADNCGADWNEQAAKKAQEYLNTMSFSRSGLIEQLEFEGFTHEQAVYGVEAAGY